MGRQEGAAVVDGAAEVGRRVDRDVTGQVLVLGAQAVKHPTAYRRPGELRLDRAGVKLDDGLRMGWRIGVQSADEAELVHVPRRLREELGNPGAGLTVLGEAEPRGGEGAAAGSDAAIAGLEHRLVLPRVHLRHRAFHEQEDDPLGASAKMRLTWRQRPGLPARLSAGARRLLPEHPGQREIPETSAGGFQDLPTAEKWIQHLAISIKALRCPCQAGTCSLELAASPPESIAMLDTVSKAANNRRLPVST